MSSPNSDEQSNPLCWRVYILLCRDQTYYIGATNNLDSRVKTHNAGQGAKYTRGRTPVRLVYAEEFKTKRKALQREAELKRRSRTQKEFLVTGTK